MKRLVLVLAPLLMASGMVVQGSAAAPTQVSGPPDGSVSWLALGDSYSSGEGNWTLPASDRCQRADGKDGRGRAWAVVAQQELAARGLAFPADQFQLKACTGAVSGGLSSDKDDPTLTSNWAKQFAEAGSRPADLVTFSFGGNNVGFANVILECVGIGSFDALNTLGPHIAWDQNGRSCTAGEPQLAKAVNTWATNRDSQQFGLPLPLLLEQVASRAVNPGGKVVVAGYPQLFEESGRWGVWNGNHCARVRAKDADTIRGLVSLMNQRLKEGAEAASGKTNSVEIVYVDAASVYESPAGRHGLCTGEPWINGLSLPRHQRSFHPTQAGHDALGRAVADRISELDFSTVVDPAGCSPAALKLAAVSYASAKGIPGSITDVRDSRCNSGWARGCVINSITGDTDCTRFFKLVEGRWSQLDLNWDACPSDLIDAGAGDRVALELAADCPAAEISDEPSGSPVLGAIWGPYVEGFGGFRPIRVFFGGDPTGLVDNITWDEWGGDTATGTGTAAYMGPDTPTVADSTLEPATIVAFNLGRCPGSETESYTSVTWYFPTKGEQFDPTVFTDACTGDYVDQNEAGD